MDDLHFAFISLLSTRATLQGLRLGLPNPGSPAQGHKVALTTPAPKDVKSAAR